MLGAAWRENLRWPDRRIGKDPAHLEQAVAFIRRHRPRVVAVPYWSDRHPDHVAASEVLTEAVVQRGLRRYPAERRGVEARMDLLLLHQRRRHAVVRRRRVRRTTSRSARALDCHASQFQPDALPRRRGHAPEHAAVPAAHRKPRRAVRRAGRRHVGGRRRRARADRAVEPCMKDGPMNIGIVCYASIGGSGIIATELGKTLASRGHHVHILSSDTPFRLGDYQPGLSFHRVETPTLSAVPRAAVPAVARQQDRAGVARRAARHRPRALRDPARDGGVSGAPDSRRAATAGPRRRSSRRCTAPTSRCSAATARTRKPSRSASSSPTA